MADSSVNALTKDAPAAGETNRPIDTRTQPDGDHRQVIVLGDALATTTAPVGLDGVHVDNRTLAPDAATETTSAAILAASAAILTELGQKLESLASVEVSNLPADPATQTTSAAILAAVDGLEALVAATNAALATIQTELGQKLEAGQSVDVGNFPADPATQTTLAAVLAAIDTLETLLGTANTTLAALLTELGQKLETLSSVAVSSLPYIAVTPVTVARTTDGDLFTPTSGFKLRFLGLTVQAATANTGSVRIALKWGSGGAAFFVADLAAGQPMPVVSAAGNQYIEGAVDQSLYLDITGTGEVLVNGRKQEL